MSSEQRFVLATVVTCAKWRTNRRDVLATAHAVLDEQMQLQRLVTHDPRQEAITVLPCRTRLRVTITTDVVPLPSVS